MSKRRLDDVQVLDKSTKKTLKPHNDRATKLLLIAAERGSYEDVVRAIKNGADVNAEDGKDGNTSLHFVAQSGRLDIVKYLIQNGAKVDLENEDNETPFSIAAKYADLDIVKFFINNSTTELSTENYNYAFGNAIQYGYLSIVEFFLNIGVDPNNKVGMSFTHLQIAARAGKTDIVKLLLNRGAYVNEKDKDSSWTALYCSLLEKNIDTAIVLIENGGDVNDVFLRLAMQKKLDLPHFSAAVWCQNVRMGQINEIPSNLGEDPILLLAKIMKGQLAEEGSIETLNQILNSDNSTVRSIIETHNFVEDTTNAIIEKHAVRLYNNISFGKVYNNLGLDTILQEQQDMIVNKVKSLCGGITIDNEKLSRVFEGDSVPEHMKQELQQFFCTNEGGALVSIMGVESEAVVGEPLVGQAPDIHDCDL